MGKKTLQKNKQKNHEIIEADDASLFHVTANELLSAATATHSSGRHFKKSWVFDTVIVYIYSKNMSHEETKKKSFPSGLMERDWLRLLQLIIEN